MYPLEIWWWIWTWGCITDGGAFTPLASHDQSMIGTMHRKTYVLFGFGCCFYQPSRLSAVRCVFFPPPGRRNPAVTSSGPRIIIRSAKQSGPIHQAAYSLTAAGFGVFHLVFFIPSSISFNCASCYFQFVNGTGECPLRLKQ